VLQVVALLADLLGGRAVIPNNVYAEIKATTVFGNMYVPFESPKNP
jgi:ABC-type transporter Mla subunit MlaD